ncbi:hypothetical protein ACFYP4_02395 [Streptomyces sp. NPDC005551]|uniref:hypothetical protein n=1 Tax=Streptomyces sp. NPDC005551 TaxID=3364725 RepID=UPI0036C97E52
MEYMEDVEPYGTLIFRWKEGGTTIEVGRPQNERLDGPIPEEERVYSWDWNISVYDHATGKRTIATYDEFRAKINEWIDDEKGSGSEHWHIGANMPGYLPESDVHCVDNIGDALGVLSSELDMQADDWAQNCPDIGDPLVDESDDHCGWCEVAAKVREYDERTDSDSLREELKADGKVGVVFTPPEGAPLHYWIVTGEGYRHKCEIAQEQDQ